MRIHVYIADDSAPWNLTREEFQRQFSDYRPDARATAGYQERGGEYLEFDLDSSADGREGTYWPGLQLVLHGGRIQDCCRMARICSACLNPCPSRRICRAPPPPMMSPRY